MDMVSLPDTTKSTVPPRYRYQSDNCWAFLACDLITGTTSDVEDHIFYIFSKLPKPKRRFFNCDPFLLLHLFAVLLLGRMSLMLVFGPSQKGGIMGVRWSSLRSQNRNLRRLWSFDLQKINRITANYAAKKENTCWNTFWCEKKPGEGRFRSLFHCDGSRIFRWAGVLRNVKLKVVLSLP